MGKEIYYRSAFKGWTKICIADDERSRLLRVALFYARIEPWGA